MDSTRLNAEERGHTVSLLLPIGMAVPPGDDSTEAERADRGVEGVSLEVHREAFGEDLHQSVREERGKEEADLGGDADVVVVPVALAFVPSAVGEVTPVGEEACCCLRGGGRGVSERVVPRASPAALHAAAEEATPLCRLLPPSSPALERTPADMLRRRGETTHDARMKVHARDPLVRPRDEQLALHELLHREDDPILDPEPDRRSRVLDGLVGVLDLFAPLASAFLSSARAKSVLGRYDRRESRSRRRGRSLFQWRTGGGGYASVLPGGRRGDEADHGEYREGSGRCGECWRWRIAWREFVEGRRVCWVSARGEPQRRASSGRRRRFLCVMD